MTLSVFEARTTSPNAAALVCDGVRLTFATLAERVQARYPELAARGVDRRDERPVALVVDASLAMFEYLYLLFALGIPVLPIHPRLTAPERHSLLELGAAQALIDPSHTEPSVAYAPGAWLAPVVSDHRPLVFVPSSGSTGSPKLVELSRRAFLASIRADAAHVAPRPQDRALLCLPLSHVGGLSVVTRSLAARRCCVVFRAPRASLLDSMSELSQSLIAERISLLSLIPPLLTRLLREEPSIARLAPLRAVLLGGQACSTELFDAAQAAALPVLTSYGLTEMCSQVSTLGFPPPARAPCRRGVVGVGLPLAGVELRVQGGLIQVRGPSLFTRYVGQPPPGDESGFFNTGDRGEFDPEHGLFVYGRAGELIVSGGENVDPSEVEHALLAFGGIVAACVFGAPDLEFGERVAAALELSPGSVFDERAAFTALDQRLASFKRPRAVCYFETLPRLASGKLDRSRIRVEAAPHLRPVDRT